MTTIHETQVTDDEFDAAASGYDTFTVDGDASGEYTPGDVYHFIRESDGATYVRPIVKVAAKPWPGDPEKDYTEITIAPPDR